MQITLKWLEQVADLERGMPSRMVSRGKVVKCKSYQHASTLCLDAANQLDCQVKAMHGHKVVSIHSPGDLY